MEIPFTFSLIQYPVIFFDISPFLPDLTVYEEISRNSNSTGFVETISRDTVGIGSIFTYDPHIFFFILFGFLITFLVIIDPVGRFLKRLTQWNYAFSKISITKTDQKTSITKTDQKTSGPNMKRRLRENITTFSEKLSKRIPRLTNDSILSYLFSPKINHEDRKTIDERIMKIISKYYIRHALNTQSITQEIDKIIGMVYVLFLFSLFMVSIVVSIDDANSSFGSKINEIHNQISIS